MSFQLLQFAKSQTLQTFSNPQFKEPEMTPNWNKTFSSFYWKPETGLLKFIIIFSCHFYYFSTLMKMFSLLSVEWIWGIENFLPAFLFLCLFSSTPTCTHKSYFASLAEIAVHACFGVDLEVMFDFERKLQLIYKTLFNPTEVVVCNGLQNGKLLLESHLKKFEQFELNFVF